MNAAPARIGWVGLGHIGTPMAERALAAGLPLTAWARRPETLQALRQRGADTADSPAALAASCDLVATVVGGPADVAELLAQMLPAARPGTVFIDFSTASALQGESLQRQAQALGLHLLDAPITGGVAGAQRGQLTCFVGGEATALERARPLLAAFSQRIVPCGPWGSGYRMKLINQTLVAGTLMGLADGARLARALGLPPQAVPDALAQGTAGGPLLASYWERMQGAGGAVSFSLGLLRKDLQLVAEEAAHLGLNLPQVQATLAAVEAACARHGVQAGVQMLAVP